MWTQTHQAAADLDRALHQGPRHRALPSNQPRQGLETLTIPTPDSQLIADYLTPYSGTTLANKSATLRQYHRWLQQAGTTLTEARDVHINAWIRTLRSTTQLSPATITTKIREIRHLYTWANETGRLPANPALHIRTPPRPRRTNIQWLNRDELNTLLTASINAGPPWDLAIHLYALNGLRRSEAINARIEHLSTISNHITLLLPDRKQGTMTRVSLPAPTLPILDTNIGTRKTGLILRYKRRRISPLTLYRHMDKISTDAGLTIRVRPHMLRATFITLSLDADIPYRDIMASTGHASTTMVDYYDRAYAAIERNASHRLTTYLTE